MTATAPSASGRQGRPREVAVLAGTGKSGRRVAAALRIAGHRVRVAGRGGPVVFDWEDPSTWSGLVDGADAVYLVVPTDSGEPVVPFVETALAAGVGGLVMLSGRGLEQWRGRFGDTMVEGERAVAATGIGTVLRASNFTQNFTEEAWAPGVRAGRLALPAEHVADSFVDLGDVAEVAAGVLTEPGHEGRTYELTGPESLSFERAVAILAAATARNIRFQAVDPDIWADGLRAEGTDEATVEELAGLFDVMREGHLDGITNDIERLLGRPARSFRSWAVEQAAIGAWG